MNLKEFLGLNFYTSGLDDFLAEYDRRHPKLSSSQRAELEKYKRIYRLRDESGEAKTETTFWDKF